MDKDNGQEPQPQPQASVLVIEFTAPGSAEFAIKSQNVSPAQLLAAAEWLRWNAWRAFDRIAEQRQAQRIAVPVSFDPRKLWGDGGVQ